MISPFLASDNFVLTFVKGITRPSHQETRSNCSSKNHFARRRAPLRPRSSKLRPKEIPLLPSPPQTNPQRRRIRSDPRPLARATRLPRPLNLSTETLLRSLHVINHHPLGTDHATPIPKPPQLHDLRWFPPEINVRAGIYLRLCRLPHSTNIHRSRPLDIPASGSGRLGTLLNRHSRLLRLASRPNRRHKIQSGRLFENPDPGRLESKGYRARRDETDGDV